jgi:hypothetical protein
VEVEGEQAQCLSVDLPPQQLLWFHWLRSREFLRALASLSDDRPPLNERTEYSPELLHRAIARVQSFELLFARMRRIEGYLGGGRQPSVSASPSTLEAAKTIRANIERGDSDEAIALFLGEWREPNKKRGRPKGSNDSDSMAVLALQLHDSNPKFWTWPKVADRLLDCKSHKAHSWDSECTAKLKQAVSRLRTFLEELQSD